MKNMKKLLAIIAAIAAITTAAHARIGETLEQAIERYGEPSPGQNAGWTVFFKGGFQVNTHFHGGAIDAVEYIKTEGLETAKLSEVEVQNFLNANYAGNWQASSWRSWFAPNLGALQEYHVIKGNWAKGYHRLVIWTAAAGRRAHDKVALEETEAQAGF